MTAREWKPGDVIRHNDGMIGLVVSTGFGCKHGPAESLHVHYEDGDWDGRVVADRAHPLVVIDLNEDPVEGDRAGRNEAQMLVSMLRETAENFFTPDAGALAVKVADQIEAQTAAPKPSCSSHINVKGEHFACELDAPHPGLAHSNKAAEAIWGEPA